MLLAKFPNRMPENHCVFDIKAAIESGKFDQAIHIFLEYSIHPDRKSLLLLLKACAKLRSIERGRAIHAESVKHGMERDLILGTILVDMYAKCGCLVDAQEIFDELAVHDVVSWTALISGYAENGLNEETLKCLVRMQAENVSPNSVTYICTLKGCGNLKEINMGYGLHAEIIKEGFEKELFIGSTLVDMYAKCGFLKEAQEIFEELTLRNIVTWNALIAGYAKHGVYGAMLDSLEHLEFEGLSPDMVTYICCLKGCGDLKMVNIAQPLYSQITSKGLEQDFNLCTTIVNTFTKCGLIFDALKIFNAMPVHDTILWNTLIGGFIENELFDEVLVHLEDMDIEGISLEGGTLIHYFKACGSLGAINVAHRIHAIVIKQGYDEDISVCNVLLDTYVKCGFLVEALDVFEKKRHVCDVVSWTTIISGYIDLGLGDEAVACLEKMQNDDLDMDNAIFLCSLKVCSIVGDISRGQALHAKLIEEGYEEDQFIGNTLIDMYAKGGLLMEAQEVFYDMPIQDGVSWNAIISGFAENQNYEEALEMSSVMSIKGIPFSTVTYICNLKSCAMIGALRRGREMHIEVMKYGLELEIFLTSTIIDMYSRFGLFIEACSVLEEFRTCEAVPWNALIAGYADHGLGEEALGCMRKMHLECVMPDVVTYVCVLKGCSCIGSLESGQEMHAEIIKRAIEKVPCIESILVDMYVKCDSLVDACKVFESISERDVVVWTSLIVGHAEYGLIQDVFNCLKEMAVEGVFPNAVTYACILKACCNVQNIHKCQEIYSEIAKEGFEDDASIGTMLVDMYAKCGFLTEAHEVMIDMEVSEVSSWTALIAGYVEHGFSSEALQCFEQMEDNGILSSNASYTCCLKACGSTGNFDKGLEIHGNISVRGLEMDLLVGSTVVDMYVKCGSLHEALVVFEKLPHRDVVSWNALLGGYSSQGKTDVVIMFLEKMMKEVIQPDRITFLNILFVCSHSGLVQEGLMFFEVIERKYGVIPCLEHCNSIIDLLMRIGQHDAAVTLLDNMPFQPDLVTWSTLLGSCHKWDHRQISIQAIEYATNVGGEKVASFRQMCRL